MEGMLFILIGLISEALSGIAVLSAGALVGFLGSLFSALVNLVSAVIGPLAGKRVAVGAHPPTSSQADSRRVPPAGSPMPKRQSPRWARWLMIASLGMLGLVVAAVLVIDIWFADDLLRWALAGQERRSGVHVESEKIAASLLRGRYELSGVRATRHDHPAGEIDLSARTVSVSVPFWSAWKRTVPIRSVRIDGLRGSYHLGRSEGKNASQADDEQGYRSSPDLERKPPRKFSIESLEVADVEVEVTDYTRRRPIALPITIGRMTSSPLRSNWALFDILFRSNADGTLMGRPFRITTGGDENGRETKWSISDLPVEALSAMIGGPFSLITEGRCDVRVTDRWQLTGDGLIEMDWKIVLHDLRCEVPPNLCGTRRALANAVVAMLNANPIEVPLGFTLGID